MSAPPVPTSAIPVRGSAAGRVHSLLLGNAVPVTACRRSLKHWRIAADQPIGCKLCLARMARP